MKKTAFVMTLLFGVAVSPAFAEDPTHSGFGAYFAEVTPPGFTDPETAPAIAASDELDADGVAAIEPAAGEVAAPQDDQATEAAESEEEQAKDAVTAN